MGRGKGLLWMTKQKPSRLKWLSVRLYLLLDSCLGNLTLSVFVFTLILHHLHNKSQWTKVHLQFLWEVKSVRKKGLLGMTVQKTKQNEVTLVIELRHCLSRPSLIFMTEIGNNLTKKKSEQILSFPEVWFIFSKYLIFSCPGQLNRWHCQSVTNWLTKSLLI